MIHLSSKTIASLAWWISPSGFAANATAPIRELSPTVDIWTDASLDRGGGHCSRRDLSRGLGPLVSWWMIQVSTCWRLGQPENLCWPWLSLGIVLGSMLTTGLLLLISNIREVLEVTFFLRRLSFSGNKLSPGTSSSCLLTGFQQRKTLPRTSCPDIAWISRTSDWTGRCSSPFWITLAWSQRWMPSLAAIRPGSQGTCPGTRTPKLWLRMPCWLSGIL